MVPIVVLSTDTTHHRYFLNRLRNDGLPIGPVLFETTSVKAPFETGPLYEKEEEKFERFRWSEWLSLEGFDIHQVENFNHKDSLVILNNWQPVFGLVFGARRLKPVVLNQISGGLVNVHRGIAQNYRGLDSELWSIYHHDWDSIGVTLHLMDSNLDTGPIVAQEKLSLCHKMKIHQLRAYTTEMATRMMSQVVQAQLDGCLKGQTQPAPGRYYSFMPLVLKKIIQTRFNQYCEGLPK